MEDTYRTTQRKMEDAKKRGNKLVGSKSEDFSSIDPYKPQTMLEKEEEDTFAPFRQSVSRIRSREIHF
jgi:hypothetical protein